MPPAGWYPDPASDEHNRYWDGQAWTDRVQPKSMPPPPAAPPPMLPPRVATPPGADPAPAPQPGSAGSFRPSGPYPQEPAAGHQPAAPGYGPGGPPLVDPYGGYAPAPATIGPPVGRTGPPGQLLSGWWRRVGGYLIDGIVVALPALIAWVVATAVITSSGGVILQEGPLDDLEAMLEAGDTPTINDILAIVGPGFWTVVVISLAVWLIASLINGVYLVSRSGQTIGDRVVSVRKVMADRSVPTVGTALARWLIPNVLFAGVGNLVPFGFLLVYANYLWPLWDSRSRTLHDMMVKTYVERADLAGPAVPRG